MSVHRSHGLAAADPLDCPILIVDDAKQLIVDDAKPSSAGEQRIVDIHSMLMHALDGDMA